MQTRIWSTPPACLPRLRGMVEKRAIERCGLARLRCACHHDVQAGDHSGGQESRSAAGKSPEADRVLDVVGLDRVSFTRRCPLVAC